MDEEALERFDALPESDLKEDILQHIQKSKMDIIYEPSGWKLHDA